MNIESFDDLLQAARQQSQPQRLLFVFARIELPPDATAEQRARFEAGQGGALVPLMCVDKTPQELSGFAALVEESRQFELPDAAWGMVFVAAMGGRDGQAPSSQDADQPLQRMVEDIKRGAIGAYLPLDREGRPVRLA